METFRTLIIESDTRWFHDFMVATLESALDCPFDFVRVESLQEAMQVLSTQEMRLVLLGSGIEKGKRLRTAKALRTRYPHLPLILLLDKANSRTYRAAYELGVSDCLVRNDITARMFVHAANRAMHQQAAEIRSEERKAWRFFDIEKVLDQKLNEYGARR